MKHETGGTKTAEELIGLETKDVFVFGRWS